MCRLGQKVGTADCVMQHVVLIYSVHDLSVFVLSFLDSVHDTEIVCMMMMMMMMMLIVNAGLMESTTNIPTGTLKYI